MNRNNKKQYREKIDNQKIKTNLEAMYDIIRTNCIKYRSHKEEGILFTIHF